MHALRALGDLAMNCSVKFTPYFLDQTTQALCMAARSSVQFGCADQLDEETAEFLKELREEVLKAFTAVIIVTEDINAEQAMVTNLQSMFDFIDRLI